MGLMLSRTVEIEPVNIRTQEIIKVKEISIVLKDKYLEYIFKAKVQDYGEDGTIDGDQRIVDSRYILFRENLCGVTKRYLSVDKVTEVEIYTIGGNAIRIYFKSDEKADDLMDALLNYKLGTQ